MRKVTIEDISRDTGLSRGTVSRALNDRPDISTQTKQKVLDACRKLNYVPSHAARSLATGKNYAVAVIADDLRSAFTADFLRGAIREAEKAHYATHVSEIGPDASVERLATIASERVDGLLNASQLSSSDAMRVRDIFENRALASCYPLDGVSCDVFTPDFVEAGRIAARFLIRNNRQKPLFVTGGQSPGAFEKNAGFRQICQENGIDADACTATLSQCDAIDNIRSRIGQSDAIVADDDYLAVSLMLLCERMGRSPGSDIAVLAFGNERVAERTCPSLTTIDLEAEEIGRRSMGAILRRISQPTNEPTVPVLVAPRLIQRSSTTGLS